MNAMCSRKCAAPLSEASSNLLPASIQTPTAAVSALAVALVATLKRGHFDLGHVPQGGEEAVRNGRGVPELGEDGVGLRGNEGRKSPLRRPLRGAPQLTECPQTSRRHPSPPLAKLVASILGAASPQEVLSRVLGNVGGNLFFFFFRVRELSIKGGKRASLDARPRRAPRQGGKTNMFRNQVRAHAGPSSRRGSATRGSPLPLPQKQLACLALDLD